VTNAPGWEAEVHTGGLSVFVVCAAMKKHRTRRTEPLDPEREMTRAMAERMKMNLELLEKLVFAYAANEEAQRRFRYAVVSRLARIEATVGSMQGLQCVHMNMHGDWLDETKAEEDAQTAEGFIAGKTEALGLAMIKYIHGGPDAFKAKDGAAEKQAKENMQGEQRSRTRRPRQG
jgi:hypothetical protein